MDNIAKSPRKIREGFIGQKMIVLPRNIRKEIIANPLINGVYLTDIGYYPLATYHYRERKSGSQQYILIYCIEGEGWIFSEDRRFELKSHSYFIIPRGVAHSYGTDNTFPWSIYWTHFNGNNADILYKRYTKESPPEVRIIAFDEKRVELFNQLFSMLENGYSSRNIEIINLKFLQLISSFIYQDEQLLMLSAHDTISKSILFMKQHLNTSYTVKELAAQLNFSVSHYANQFKLKTGYSPIHYFNHLKVQKACQYLLFTNLSIKEACQEVGFQDPYYFSRIFKKFMGLSPARYKNKYQN